MKKNFLLNSVVVLSSLIFTLLLVEIFFRLFLPQDLITPMAAQLDQEIIYTLTPNTESYLRGTSSRFFHLKTNSLGLREAEIDQTDFMEYFSKRSNTIDPFNDWVQEKKKERKENCY